MRCRLSPFGWSKFEPRALSLKRIFWDLNGVGVVINDLPRVISKDSSIALYADDSKMYRVISTQEDLSTFQSDIDKISDWCKMNKMRINTKKCKIMRITRKKSPLVGEYNIEGQPLESVDVYQDLDYLLLVIFHGTNT